MTAAAGPQPSERQFQRMVVACQRDLGWETYHAWLSVRSQPGWPDLALLRPPRLILAELKAERGKLSPAQERWLQLLRAVPSIEVYVWYPRDWDALVEVLR